MELTTQQLTEELRRRETLLRQSRQELEDGQSDGELSDDDLLELEETTQRHRRERDSLRDELDSRTRD